jgi:outer membrane immunogenic protein
MWCRSLALSAAVALCGGLSQTTFAADMSVKAPPPPVSEAPTWTGCYADAGLGYGVSNTDHSGTLAFGLPATTDNITDGGRGWLGRFGAGCDYQFKVLNNWNVVAGLFGDYDAADIHGSFTGAFPLGTFPLGTPLTGEQKERSAWAVGPRIGFLVTPTVLTYWDGGYTQASFNSIGLAAAGVPTGSFYPSNTYNGWFLGGGTDIAISMVPGLFWRSEYRYSSYRSENLIGQGGPSFGPPGNGFAESFKQNVQTVTSSLVWRFNWTGH